MSDDLRGPITTLEEARAEFVDARAHALILAARQINSLEQHSTAVQSAQLFDQLVAITDRAIEAKAYAYNLDNLGSQP